jgi:uncharacterized protein YbjQ (UPF0145 family)
VVGVRLKRRNYAWNRGLLEFAAIGTAIREANVTREQAKKLFLSELSGEEFWKLRQAGFRPVGVAVGNCTYYQIPSWSTQSVTTGGWFNRGSWQNQELPEYTQALYTARELAMSRMEEEARQVGATGIVSVEVEVDTETQHAEGGGPSGNQTRLDMMYHFTAIGTAIAPASAPGRALSPTLTVSLKDGGLSARGKAGGRRFAPGDGDAHGAEAGHSESSESGDGGGGGD